MKYHNIVLIIAILLLSNCKKEAEVIPRSYPYIILDDISDNDGTGVGLKAKIVSATSYIQIKEFGFVIGTESKPTIMNRKIIVGIDKNTDEFHFKIESDLFKDESYSARAYIKTNKYIVYSNEKTFISNGIMAPRIYQIYPDYGSPGKLITIVGDYFSEKKINNIVRFGEENANVIFSNRDTLVVQCPTASSNINTKISVEVARKVTTYSKNFNLINAWTELDNFPGEVKYWSSYFTIEDKGYVSLGMLGSELASTDLWAYDVNNKQWQLKSEFPGEKRKRALSFSANGLGYFGLGYTGTSDLYSLNDLWQYDPVSDSWKKMADFPGNNAFSIPPHFVINNKLYLTSELNSELWVFDPSINNWTYLPKDGHFQNIQISEGFSINNTGYFIEQIGEVNTEKSIVIWKYDDLANKLSFVDTVLTKSYWNYNFNIANKIYFYTPYRLAEYNLENKLIFYHKLSSIQQFNFIFSFEEEAILNFSQSNGVYEFYPQ